jgi:alpha-ketoglutarate-dependent taurine dioxygenase
MRHIETLNSFEFSDDDLVINDIRFNLSKFDSVIVHNPSFEQSNNLLLKLVNIIGTVSEEDVTVPDFETSNYLHRVEICKESVKDRYGFRPLSTTDSAIACHTEDYFTPNPSDIVIFQCVRQDHDGGQSIISYLDDILYHLDIDVLNCLKECEYPSYFGKVAVIGTDIHGKYWIRYNRSTLNKASDVINLRLSKEYKNALDYLDIAINKSQIIFPLQPNDIWLLNNRRVMHGRTALSKETSRLLKRVKLHV